jgi:hypothetical protein
MSLFEKWSAIWTPEIYHGKDKRPPFFEGWYYKLTEPNQGQSIAFIPGVFFGSAPNISFSFIQVVDEERKQVTFFRFPLDAFSSEPNPFRIQIQDNIFSKQEIRVNLSDGVDSLNGSIELSDALPWPVTFALPGYMGWFAFLPFVQCYHGVVNRNSLIRSGELTINGRSISFQEGKGYIEKDWGNSFPESYLWLQSNHFEDPNVSLVVSLARMMIMGKARKVFVVGLTLRERFFCFANYTRASVTLTEITTDQIRLSVEDRHFHLEIKADRTPGLDLVIPSLKGMEVGSNQTLSSKLDVTLSKKSNGILSPLFSQIGKSACLEVKGNLSDLGFLSPDHTSKSKSKKNVLKIKMK